MVSKKLVHMIEKHEEELTRRWLKDVKHHGDNTDLSPFSR